MNLENQPNRRLQQKHIDGLLGICWNEKLLVSALAAITTTEVTVTDWNTRIISWTLQNTAMQVAAAPLRCCCGAVALLMCSGLQTASKEHS